MEIQKILTGLLSKAYKLDDGKIGEILNAENATEDSVIKELLEIDTERISKIKPQTPKGETFQDGYAKAKKEVLQEFEANLKKTHNIESDNTGTDLIDEILQLKAAELAKVESRQVVPAVLASAQAVLNESQMENGVAVIDLGGATTGVAVFEEGDLQYVAVVPFGGVNVTNDIAIGLKVDPEIAEQVKLAHARLTNNSASEKVEITYEKTKYSFNRHEVDEIVEARYEEIFEAVAKELKKAGCAGKLPSGVVLTGGGAHVQGIVEFAKAQLEVAAKIGMPTGYAGVSEEAERPEFAAAVGLMLADSVGAESAVGSGKGGKTEGVTKKVGGLLSNLMAKFK